MSRKARQKSESQIYHIIVKGINGQLLFEEDEDKEVFLEKVKYYQGELGFEVHSYCLMDNHVHILIKDVEDNLDKIMKSLCVSYVIYFNKKYERSGPLFNDRYKSEAVETDLYYIKVQRYIHQNPEKAGIEKTAEYIWSSYSKFIDKEKPFIERQYLLELLGGQEAYIEYMNSKNDDECLEVKEERVKDKEAAALILAIAKVKNLTEIKNMDKSKQKEIIKKCKKYKISIRQISRLMGVSKKIVERA